MRFSDWTGQMFQSDGARITWAGWRYVRFPLTGQTLHHWGGADDGIIHYPIFIDTLILLDSNRRKMEGAVYIAEPTMLYGDGGRMRE